MPLTVLWNATVPPTCAQRGGIDLGAGDDFSPLPSAQVRAGPRDIARTWITSKTFSFDAFKLTAESRVPEACVPTSQTVRRQT